jgi:hypothetical protein
MKELLPKLLIALALLGGVAVAFMQTDKYLKIRAVEGCMTATTYSFEDKGIKTVEPKKETYIQCLKDKGYEQQK